MKSSITATLMPLLSIELEPGESIFSETAELAWMSPQLDLKTTLGQGRNGVGKLIKRTMGGSSAFLTRFEANTTAGAVTFSAKFPGSIVPMTMTPEHPGYLINRHSFICGTPDVVLSVGLQRRIGVAVYGKEGFLLQKISGTGTGWLELGGEVISYTLEADEQLAVHPGHIGAFEATVTPHLRTVKGISTKLFGKDGFFMVYLQGPGTIWLQSLTLPLLAKSLEAYLIPEAAAAGAGVTFIDAAVQTVIGIPPAK